MLLSIYVVKCILKQWLMHSYPEVRTDMLFFEIEI